MTNKAQVRKMMRRKQRRAERKEMARVISQGEGQRSDRATLDPSLVERMVPDSERDPEAGYRAAMLDGISSLNEEERTVRSVLTTEMPVTVYDYRTGKGMIDEVLVADGGRVGEKLPLLDDHSRWGSTSVIGSIRSITRDGDRWRGTLHFARNVGPQADQIWELVRQGHLTDVSIGYRYGNEDFVDISPGQSASIRGKQYKAGNRTMRVVTNWTAREASTTPIGADPESKIGRSTATGTATGLVATRVSDKTASASQAEISTAQNSTEANRMSAENVTAAPAATSKEKPSTAPATTSTRTEQPEAAQTVTAAANQPSDNRTATTAATTDYRAEADRIAYIRQAAEVAGASDEQVRQAIREKWGVDQVNASFYPAQSAEQRSEPVAPAIHTRSGGLDARTLTAALLLRSGLDIESPVFRTDEARHLISGRSEGSTRHNAAWLIEHSRNLEEGGRTRDESAARAIDQAYSMRGMSMMDICRAALEIEGRQFNRFDRDEILQRSFSTGTLQAVFTTNFAAQMLEGFVDTVDTTSGWVREADLPNFQTVERFQMHKLSKLDRTDRNQTPPDGTLEAVMESYKLHRYSNRFTVDEMDIIDDRFGALDMVPRDMGEAARVVRPDLVYSLLLANPTMGQDSTALFAAGRGNYVASGAGLSPTTLSTGKTAIANQTNNGRILNIRAQYLIVSESKKWDADKLIGSNEERDTTSSTRYGTMNPARGQFQVIGEPRLDVGVTDPSSLTGASYAGVPAAWFLATAGGRYGIEVGHLQGTGRAPVVRRYDLTEGLIGMGWLVVHYVATKAIGFQGLYQARA